MFQARHKQREQAPKQWRIVAGIVHDLSRPLAGISAAADYLRRGYDGDPDVVRELVSGIAEQAAQMRAELERLVVFLSTGEEAPAQRAPIDLAGICREACRYAQPLCERKSIVLDLRVDEDAPLICGDRRLVVRIVGNLLSNAIKYTPPTGQVRLHLAAQMCQGRIWGALLSVADDGPGIAEDEQERIFEYFHRSAAHQQLADGMGLGLAVARRLAEAHGGTLTVVSTPGTGATFHLLLPA
jgi:signal transduction histidine kinase